MPWCLYVGSTEYFRSLFLWKIGCTGDPVARNGTYQTGCPPGQSPCCDFKFDAVFETNAPTLADLKFLEEEVHDYFYKYRLMRRIPGDSEWFDFKRDALEEMKAFVESRAWFVREVALDELQRSSKFMQRYFAKNANFIKTQSEHDAKLSEIQVPVISAMREFVQSSAAAGTVIAPCGAGKTRMCVQGVRGVQKIIVCVPSNQIQQQWLRAFKSDNRAAQLVGSGLTDTKIIGEILDRPAYVLITTYMSSHLLVQLHARPDVLVLDEAHHMAGIVGDAHAQLLEGIGRTRKLLQHAVEANVKRLSLTFTPRNVESEEAVLTMNDPAVFGQVIHELKFRDLVNAGVLPDYRVWTLRDDSAKGALAKAACILEACAAQEMVNGEVRFILHHLLIFAATLKDAAALETFFKADYEGLVINVGEGDLSADICDFTAAKRAILISVYKLGEGVDIPAANAVSFACNKHSHGQITQFVLRAGRWYPGKSIFHVIIPVLSEDDFSGFETVLAALAERDERICDEIIVRATSSATSEHSAPMSALDSLPECILIEGYEATPEAIRRCFTNVRKSAILRDSKRIQDICARDGIETSVEYAAHGLPEIAKPTHMTWFDFLHPDTVKITASEFAANLRQRGITAGCAHDSTRSDAPSTQHIKDGYFPEFNTFEMVLEKFGTQSFIRRR